MEIEVNAIKPTVQFSMDCVGFAAATMVLRRLLDEKTKALDTVRVNVEAVNDTFIHGLNLLTDLLSEMEEVLEGDNDIEELTDEPTDEPTDEQRQQAANCECHLAKQ